MRKTTIPAEFATGIFKARPAARWVSADKQSTIDTRGAPAEQALAELLEQCGSDEQRAEIMSGAFVIES